MFYLNNFDYKNVTILKVKNTPKKLKNFFMRIC